MQRVDSKDCPGCLVFPGETEERAPLDRQGNLLLDPPALQAHQVTRVDRVCKDSPGNGGLKDLKVCEDLEVIRDLKELQDHPAQGGGGAAKVDLVCMVCTAGPDAKVHLVWQAQKAQKANRGNMVSTADMGKPVFPVRQAWLVVMVVMVHREDTVFRAQTPDLANRGLPVPLVCLANQAQPGYPVELVFRARMAHMAHMAHLADLAQPVHMAEMVWLALMVERAEMGHMAFTESKVYLDAMDAMDAVKHLDVVALCTTN